MRTVTLPDGRTRKKLETWGEIANYLGVEIRTAQRWEGRMGLPVARIDGGQAVFAFADELDAWRASREVRRSGQVSERPEPQTVATLASIPDEPKPPDRAPIRGRNALLWIASVLAAGIVGFTAARTSQVQRPPDTLEASRLVLDGQRLVALDAVDRVVWTYKFQRQSSGIETVMRPNFASWWERLDTDGDGTDEFVAVVRAGDGYLETLYCFSVDGRLRYAYTLDLMMRFEQRSFSGEWRFWDIEAVDGHDGRQLWVALESAGWWATAVMRIDANGVVTQQYAQPGVIKALAVFRDGEKTRVLVGGINNEYAAATLAVLDPDGPPATAPQKGSGPYTCLSCPTGAPLKYFVFPPSPLSVAEGRPYNEVFTIEVTQDSLRLATYETELGRIWYQLTRGLDVESATPSDAYWSWKPKSDRSWRGKEGHAHAITVRTWMGGKWSSKTITIAGLSALTSLSSGKRRWSSSRSTL